MVEGRSFLIFMGAVLLAAPIAVAAGFTVWISTREVDGQLIGFATVGIAMISAFVLAFMGAVKFLDQFVG
ncbi:hypothetical protein ACQPZF_10255 [Actinosynnema sp. CS-041913]|uniref:hypothetical protein n=1 Tax=Actinosynnema sp. CS-041913 TaxID=3239917 RepID=UPI003D91B075